MAAMGQKIPVAETTWLEGIISVESQIAPDGMKVLLYTLMNGHRYAIPLPTEVLRATQKIVSPVTIVGMDALPPNNSHGA